MHVWRVPVPAVEVPALGRVLTDDERARARTFCFDEDRRRFTVARGVLRLLLAHYLGADPRHLRFASGPGGKPAVAGVPGRPRPSFSTSHSGDLALIAIAAGRDVGVDVQEIRTDADVTGLAAHLCRCQQAALAGLPETDRRRAFFAAWVRTEAYLKATGAGLSSLAAVDLCRPTDRWWLRALPVDPGYAAAVAAEGRDWRLACWRWTG